MNKAYLENLLGQARTLGTSDYELAEDLKIRTKDAFLKLFPDDYNSPANISKLIFKESINSLDIGSRMNLFSESQNKLIRMLQAKVDLLNAQEKREKNTIKAPDVHTVKVNQLEQEIKDLNKSLLETKNHNENNNRMDKWKNIGVLGFIATLIGGSFALGVQFGTTKYDKDKINLDNEVRVLKDSIKTINKNKK